MAWRHSAKAALLGSPTGLQSPSQSRDWLGLSLVLWLRVWCWWHPLELTKLGVSQLRYPDTAALVPLCLDPLTPAKLRLFKGSSQGDVSSVKTLSW